jgi:uncharacterized damage-inducible protein DinB
VDPNSALRKELDRLLSGEGAHMDFTQAVGDWPVELRGAKPAGLPHSAWQLLDHLRIAQWDMLEFSRDAKHVSPAWPEGYWSATTEPPDEAAWDKAVAAFESDRAAMRALVSDPASDLFTPFAHGEGQSLLREALQMADHNAYHVGQLVSLRRALGI